MKKQWHSYGTCGKLLSSYHTLWRHKKNCRSAPYNIPTSDITTFNVNDDKMFTAKRHFDGGADKETGPKNPKIQDEIINDTPDDVDVASQMALPTVAVKQNSSSDVIPRVIPQQILPNPFPSKKLIVTPKPSVEVIATNYHHHM